MRTRPLLLLLASVLSFGCEGALTSSIVLDAPDEAPAPDGPPVMQEPTPVTPGDPMVEPTEPEPDPCDTQVCAGAMPLRRLTRTQYHHAIVELTGQPWTELRELLPEDESFGIFPANVDATVTALHIRQYLDAAERISQTLVIDPQGLCDPATAGETTCATAFLERFGRRAFRRPLTADERDAFERGYAAARAQGVGFEEALRLIAQVMLQSPQFLYHMENLDQDEALGDTPQPLDPFALATRLAIFLWDSIPDDALLDAAERGELADPEVLRSHVMRMLDDDRARQTMRTFHVAWLDLARARNLVKDTDRFPFYDNQTAELLIDEAVSFADHVIRRDDARLSTLLTASYAFVSPTTAPAYGVLPPDDPAQPVMLDASRRAGLITHPAFLAGHAGYADSLPIARGFVLVQRLLCITPPPPPANLNIEELEPVEGQSQREALEMHRADPACAACHSLFDPIGLSLEHFDAVGQWRDEDHGRPIDASSQLNLADLKAEFADATELAQALAESRSVSDCVAEHWMTYALGRSLGEGDEASMRRISQRFADNEGDLRELLADIATSDSFRHYVPAPEKEPTP